MVKNAKDMTGGVSPRFFVLGTTGSGKTTQFLTIPGKKFCYAFDPSAVVALQGADIDYEEFLPEGIDLGLTSLSNKGKEKADKYKSKKGDEEAGAKLFSSWESSFEEKMDEGFFNQYDAIMIDSATTFLDLIMDAILSINGRPGQWPEQGDYGPQMITFSKVVRRLNSLGKIIYLTGHTEVMKDEISGRLQNQPVLTGKLKQKIPLLFSEVLILEAAADQKGNVVWNLQLRPDKYNQSVRSSLKDAGYKQDVSIDFTKPLEGQGLWSFYKGGERDEKKGKVATVEKSR